MKTREKIIEKYNDLINLQKDISDAHNDYAQWMETILSAGPGPCPDDYNEAKKEYGKLIAELIEELSQVNIPEEHMANTLLDDIKDSRDHFVSQIEDMEPLPDPDCIIWDMQGTDCFDLRALPDDCEALYSERIRWPVDFSTSISRNLLASLITRETVESHHEFDLMPPSFVRAKISHVHEGQTKEHPTNDKLNTTTITLQVEITCENTTQTTTTKTTALTTSPTCASPEKDSVAQNADASSGEKSKQSSATSTMS